MKFWRCRCGKMQQWGSDAPEKCMRCGDCGSSLAIARDQHLAPVPHEFSVKAGKALRCRYCGRTETEVKARGKAAAKQRS